MLVYAMMLQDILGYDRMCQDMIGCTGRKRRRLGKLRAISQSDARIRSTTHTNKQTNKEKDDQQNDRALRLYTFTNKQPTTHTNKKKTTSSMKLMYIFDCTNSHKQTADTSDMTCTLTVHFNKAMLYTFDCTDCTLLTVQTVHRRLYRLYTFDFTKSHKQTNKELTPQIQKMKTTKGHLCPANNSHKQADKETSDVYFVTAI